jgi:hypothetical protein
MTSPQKMEIKTFKDKNNNKEKKFTGAILLAT